MLSYNLIKFNINKFYKKIFFKKQYLKKTQNKIYFVNQIKNAKHKKISPLFLNNCFRPLTNIFVTFIIKIYFSKTNTLFHLTDCIGSIKIFYSASVFQQKKMFQATVLQKFYKILVSKLKFCKKVPIAVHFKNVDFNIFRFLNKLKKKFFVTVEKYFSKYAYNGCKNKKI